MRRNERDDFTSIYTADTWLRNTLLQRRGTVVGRVLNTTRLTDLIYTSLSFEDVYYKTESPECPINPNALAADLFAALFSQTVRKADPSSIHLRERHFNKPVLESVLRDDRFETLKRLCEDKELTSYEAAATFAHTLHDLLQAKPYRPDKDCLTVIRMLTKQIQHSIEQLQWLHSKPNANPHFMLKLYNRIRNKMRQVEALEKKLQEEALRYVHAMGEDINQALEAAVQQAVETHSILSAWGEDGGSGQSIPANRDLVEHVKNSRELLEIARSLGKYREIVADKRRSGYSYGLGEKYDLTFGNDITNCLSSELALLGRPETEILFMRKYEQKRLMQYRKRTQVIKGKGDAIVLVDESGSTRGVSAWAKAFTLALLDISAKDRRKFAVVHFSSKDNIKTDLFEPGHYTAADVLKTAEHFWGGGTDFEAPFTEALKLMEQGYENADITIITDGECAMSEEFCEMLRSKLQGYGATVTGILLDKDSPCGESLEPFCDKIYHSRDITEDEIAVQILNQRAS